MSRPAISVVVPVCDGERHLAAALESVLAQGVRPLELIVVDDGSSDSSAAIAERYAAEGVRLLRQANLGTAAARNRGVAAARGELVAHLDADDLWPAASLETRLRALENDPTADIACGRVEEFVSAELDPEERRRLRAPRGPLPGRVLQAMLVRRRAHERVGPFDERLRAAQDLDWLLRAEEAGLRFVEVSELAVRRRLHAANKGRLHPELARLRCRVLKAALDRRRAVAEPSGS